MRWLSIGVVLACWSLPALAQLPPMPDIPQAPARDRPAGEHLKVVIPNCPDPVPLILHVSPNGSDEGDGSAAKA